MAERETDVAASDESGSLARKARRKSEKLPLSDSFRWLHGRPSLVFPGNSQLYARV